ncbi:MAG TPA: hypothetical protein VHV82_01185 [Sporichthyaceae bacterium]|jgi:hypothetical protein|nr:hypothetical protein [Sporichthyaceae bacterium]
MSVEVVIAEREVRAAFRGADAFFASSRGITIPVPRLRAVGVMSRLDAHRECSKLRLPGTALPGVLRAGSYGRGDERQLWCVHRAEQVLVLDLIGRPYCRVVLEVADPAGLAGRIGALI